MKAPKRGRIAQRPVKSKPPRKTKPMPIGPKPGDPVRKPVTPRPAPKKPMPIGPTKPVRGKRKPTPMPIKPTRPGKPVGGKFKPVRGKLR